MRSVGLMLWADLDKSKKMNEVKLWNELAWLCNVSQVEKTWATKGIVRNVR